MIVDLIREYDVRARALDASWSLSSENRRDGESIPPYRNPYLYNRSNSYLNSLDPAAEDEPGTIYLDPTDGKYKMKSSVRTIVLDYKAPYLLSMTGTFTVFADSGDKWRVECVFRDDSGIDSGAYVLKNVDTDEVLASSSRASSSPPAYAPVVNTIDGVSVRFDSVESDVSSYRVTVEIDPEAQLSFTEYSESVEYIRLSLTVFDIAGNELVFDFKDKPFTLYRWDREELSESLERLELSFVDTYPPGLFVSSDVIGKTDLYVIDRNIDISQLGFKVKFGLKPDSVGYLSGSPSAASLSQDGSYYTQKQRVDGIDRSGDVKAFAYLDASMTLPDGTSIKIDPDFIQLVRGATYVEATLGTFVTECADNIRKIYIDPFVPSVLKNEEFYGLLKLFESYLNTEFRPMASDCRIGVLEKISRIADFKDPESCEAPLLSSFAEEHGSELKFNREDVKKVARVLLGDSEASSQRLNDLVDKIYRRFYTILPYIDRWKGTDRAFDLIYRTLGLEVEIVPLWEGPEGDMVPEEEAGDDYSLSSHIDVIVTSTSFSSSDFRTLSEFALDAAKSIFPVNRVIGKSALVSKPSQEGQLTLTVSDASRYLKQSDDYVVFRWSSDRVRRAAVKRGQIELALPVVPDSVEQILKSSDVEADYPVQENVSFYFSRWMDTIHTYKSAPIFIQFWTSGSLAGSMALPFRRAEISRDKIVLIAEDSQANRTEMSTLNTLLSSSWDEVSISFQFSRSVENYCEPILYSDIEE